MIYVFHGTDALKLRSKVRDLVSSLLKKKPDALHMRVTESEWNETILPETIGSQGLFSEKFIVQLDNLLDTDAKEAIVESLADIKSSQNIFVLVENEIDAKTLKQLEKYAEKVQEFASAVVEEKEPTLFALADAFGRRDKKMLWVEYQKAREREVASEEIHGMLFWQLKSMLIAGRTNATESGLKPFVYNKSKQFSKNFKPEELQKISGQLVSMYHDAHRGLVDFGNALEVFTLSV